MTITNWGSVKDFASTAIRVPPATGVNHARLRAHNERLVLTLLRRHGALSKAEITRRTGLSAQTISVINRALENDLLVQRGNPVRGKVGQPSIPMMLDPDGAYSIGLRIGRRSADLALMDFVGTTRRKIRLTYAYPTPQRILDFIRNDLPTLKTEISENNRERIIGIGIGAPFQLYNWLDRLGAPSKQMSKWRDFDLKQAVHELTGLETVLVNDATCACLAEQAVGVGREIADYAYIFVGSFIGGGIVMNHSVQTGSTGNAGAIGPIPSPTNTNQHAQLIDTASLYLLERELVAHNFDPTLLWEQSTDWTIFEPHLSNWMSATAPAIARAILTICSVIDFPSIIVDGAFPPAVRTALVNAVGAEIKVSNNDGIFVPKIIEGTVGAEARAVGASMLPIFSRFAPE